MTRPLLLDLFCGAGGAAMGYHRADFEVVGVDINPMPNYPFEFHQKDALEFLAINGNEFDAIHASPPCQAFSVMRSMPAARTHPRLIDPVRELLKQIGLPYVIENVPGSPLHDPIMLCGSMFDLRVAGFELRRHRLFECSFPVPARECRHAGPVIGVYGGHVRCRSSQYWRDGGRDFPGYDRKKLALSAMGISHTMTMAELSEAIPPAYTEHIGTQLISAIEIAA